MPFIARKLLKQGHSQATVDLIMNSYRDSTKSQYTVYLKKWAFYCIRKKVSIMSPTLPQACDFLAELSDRGAKYSAVNSARCALSALLPKFGGRTFGAVHEVTLLCRGAGVRNPSSGRYSGFWDVLDVLEMFQEWGSNRELSLKLLGFKVAVLLLLVTAQRGQTILNLSLENIIIEKREITFYMQTMLKHNRAGEALDVISVKAYEEDGDICVVKAIKHYIKRTDKLRFKDKVKSKNHQMLVSYVAPHKPIERDTLTKWTLGVLDLAGVNVLKYGRKKFGAHSTRGAVTSKAKGLGVPINMIMKKAAWRNASSFAKHYDRPIETDPNVFSETILNAAAERKKSKKRKAAHS